MNLPDKVINKESIKTQEHDDEINNFAEKELAEVKTASVDDLNKKKVAENDQLAAQKELSKPKISSKVNNATYKEEMISSPEREDAQSMTNQISVDLNSEKEVAVPRNRKQIMIEAGILYLEDLERRYGESAMMAIILLGLQIAFANMSAILGLLSTVPENQSDLQIFLKWLATITPIMPGILQSTEKYFKYESSSNH